MLQLSSLLRRQSLRASSLSIWPSSITISALSIIKTSIVRYTLPTTNSVVKNSQTLSEQYESHLKTIFLGMVHLWFWSSTPKDAMSYKNTE